MFKPNLIQMFCEIIGIIKIRWIGYNPKSNKLTKQPHVTIKSFITSFVSKEKNWKQWLKPLPFPYNIHSSAIFSPTELMFWRKVRVRIDLLYNFKSEPTTCMVNMENLKSVLETLNELTRENMKVCKLSADVQSYVLLPRKSHLKEVQNQYEPFQTIEVTHPIYIVEMKSHQRSLSKT